MLSAASACARASRTVIPLVDGGTEGFAGHVRVIYPCVSGCFECTLDLFPPQQAVPLCTIAETPRNAAHCILYAHLIEYPKLFPDDKPDKDDPVYQNWVYAKAAERADKFGINGVTLMHTQGVIKNIIPAIASTNAIVAAACANEAFKIVSNCCAYLNNNLMYMGAGNIYAPTLNYERSPTCLVCGDGVELELSAEATLTHMARSCPRPAPPAPPPYGPADTKLSHPDPKPPPSPRWSSSARTRACGSSRPACASRAASAATCSTCAAHSRATSSTTSTSRSARSCTAVPPSTSPTRACRRPSSSSSSSCEERPYSTPTPLPATLYVARSGLHALGSAGGVLRRYLVAARLSREDCVALCVLCLAAGLAPCLYWEWDVHSF